MTRKQIKINQCSLVLNHLMRFGTISNKEAKAEYGIRSLSARILELRELGVAIQNCSKGYTLPYWVHRPKRAKEYILELPLFKEQ